MAIRNLGKFLFIFGVYILATAAAYLDTQGVAIAGPLTTGLMLSLLLFVGLIFLDMLLFVLDLLNRSIPKRGSFMR